MDDPVIFEVLADGKLSLEILGPGSPVIAHFPGTHSLGSKQPASLLRYFI